MAKKKTKKKAGKKKLTMAQKRKYIKMASEGSGMEYLMGVRMLGGISSKNMGMGPGTHPAS